MVEIIERAGLEPGRDCLIAIDVAAHSLVAADGRYALVREGVVRTTAEMIDMVEGWVEEFPIVSVEDALDEEDWAGWAELTGRIGQRVRLIGDDLFTTNAARLERGIAAHAANGILVKVNQSGTL
jgi:enolase